MLTPSAPTFMGPLTFQALSRHAVETDVLGLLPDQRIGHIVVADTADPIIVAPATARWLGAMANGIAERRGHGHLPGDLGAGRVRTRDGRRHVDAPATRDNVERLHATSATRWSRPNPAARLGPGGVGRLAELPRIVDAVVAAIGSGPVRQPDAAARPPSSPDPASPTLPAAASLSPPAARQNRSTPSASSATGAPAGWVSRSQRRPSRAGPS